MGTVAVLVAVVTNDIRRNLATRPDFLNNRLWLEFRQYEVVVGAASEKLDFCVIKCFQVDWLLCPHAS